MGVDVDRGELEFLRKILEMLTIRRFLTTDPGRSEHGDLLVSTDDEVAHNQGSRPIRTPNWRS
jgi:hypothetical protein